MQKKEGEMDPKLLFSGFMGSTVDVSDFCIPKCKEYQLSDILRIFKGRALTTSQSASSEGCISSLVQKIRS